MLLKLLRARALSDIEQRVIALLPHGAIARPMREAGVSVHELDLLGGVPLLGGTLALAVQARRFRPDLVQGWMYHGNLGASVARRAAGGQVPLLWGIRQSLPSLAGENAYARAGIRLGRLLSRDPDCITFNSLTSLEQHRAHGFFAARMRYMPNGFDVDRFAPDAAARTRLRAEWGARDDDVVFGIVARWHPVKNHAGFLRAAQQLLAARPNAVFVMAGTQVDAHNAALVDLAGALGIASRVRLLGERSDVPAIMAALDVHVSASIAEAFSNAIGEALCAAVPCVATAVGDSPQIVGAEGRIVPPNDIAALSAAMVEMVDAGATQRHDWGQRARQRMHAEFGIEAIAGRYAALYHELAERRRAQG